MEEAQAKWCDHGSGRYQVQGGNHDQSPPAHLIMVGPRQEANENSVRATNRRAGKGNE